MGRALARRILGCVALVLFAVALAMPAAADTPAERLRAAIERTAQAKSAKIALKQTAKTGARTFETAVQGALAGADSDLIASGETGQRQRVTVGTGVAERSLEKPDAPWRHSTRALPEKTTPFGALRLADGTSAGDPKLYSSVTDAGGESLPQGYAHKYVGVVNVAALATAMQLGAADRERLLRMSATLTVHLATDGSVLRHTLTVTVPGSSEPTTLETMVDLSELDAPFVISLP